MDSRNQKRSKTFDKVLDFVIKNRVQLAIAAGIIVLAAIVSGVFYTNYQNSLENSDTMYEQAVNIYNYLDSTTNSDQAASLMQSARNSLNLLSQEYPKSVAAARARLLLGRTYFMDYQQGHQDSLNMALSFYNAVCEEAPSDYYRTLGLIGRATCYEEKKDYADASADYQLIATRYSSQGFTPMALIGLARIDELLDPGNISKAVALYKKVTDEYTNSLWTMYAKGRIYFLSDPANKKAITNSALNLNAPLKLTPNN